MAQGAPTHTHTHTHTITPAHTRKHTHTRTHMHTHEHTHTRCLCCSFAGAGISSSYNGCIHQKSRGSPHKRTNSIPANGLIRYPRLCAGISSSYHGCIHQKHGTRNPLRSHARVRQCISHHGLSPKLIPDESIRRALNLGNWAVPLAANFNFCPKMLS
jgi:hypothetical protein